MKIQCGHTAHLSEFDEVSDEYAAIAEHLDHCDDCRRKLDTAQDSPDTIELVNGLRGIATGELDGALHSEPADHFAVELEPASHPELLGRLGRYEIERAIGQGGMGIVYKAMDTELHRVVAVKVLAGHLASNATARRRFAREAQAAAAVLHANVIPIYNVEASQKSPYLVMQYVAGGSLQARVDHSGPLPVVEVLRIAKQTAEALDAAHGSGLVHRDVKPANILLEADTDRVVLSDFGLARTADDASLTQTGIVAGTPHYMSPEQASGREITSASDIFSLGSVMYYALAGRPPFRAESAMGVLNCICTKAQRSVAQVNSDVPLELSRLIDRCLAKKVSRRPASARLLADDLSSILSRIQQGKIRLGQEDRYLSKAALGTALLAGIALMILLVVRWPFAAQGESAQQSQRYSQTSSGSDSSAGDTNASQTSLPPYDPSQVQWLQTQLNARKAYSKSFKQLDQDLRQIQRDRAAASRHSLWSSQANWGADLQHIELQAEQLEQALQAIPDIEAQIE